VIWLFLCCQGSQAPLPDGDAEAFAWVEQPYVSTGSAVLLNVELTSSPGSEVEISPPMADGMEILPTAPLATEPVGRRLRRRTAYRLTGEDGSYIVRPGTVGLPGEEGEELPLIFVDIGREGPIAILAAPEEPPSPMVAWPWLLAGGALLAALVVWRRNEPVSPEPGPGLLALTDWERLLGSGAGDHELSVGLSLIFRGYLDSRYGGALLSKSPSEALDWIENQSRFTEELRTCAREILTATDRLKFSGHGGGGDFFDAIDGQLRFFVAGTRPLGDR
jgi:hypothetical protein